MPELLAVKTQHFELVVWAKNVEANQQKLKRTLAARGKSLPVASLRFNPAVKLKEDGKPCGEHPLPLPLFFENTQYSFELIFEAGVNTGEKRQPKIEHSLVSINSAFHFSNRREVPVLQGTINFGNDIGGFRLPVKYYVGNECHKVTIGCDVLPTKMDYHSDLDAINQTVDEHYPLWRFALAAKTEITTDSSKNQNRPFPLLWLAQLQYLLTDLEKAIKYIIKSPHSRLVDSTSLVKIDRIRRRLPTKLAARVNNDLKRKQYHRSYVVSRKTLSNDTPENRFIKMVLNNTNNHLFKIAVAAKKHNVGSTTTQLSTAFFDPIKAMQQSLIKYRNQPLFKDVGVFSGLSGDSSWIQQKNGYGQVWRIWCKLQLYLDVLGKNASVSTKSIAALYEMWCFLEILSILESLGFKQRSSKKPRLKISGLTTKPIDEESGTFQFDRGDGVAIRLVHEPAIGKGSTPERSWIGTQKPDILLEAQFADGEKLIWLFDAKYRVDSDKSDGADWVPMDAINQMHRYRDAIFHLDVSDSGNQKSRPVFGAFALYPGFYANQSEHNCHNNVYFDAIQQIGIGAFPLLPSKAKPGERHSGNAWLCTFLTEKLGVVDKSVTQSDHAVPLDRHYIEEASRIPFKGMKQLRYRDLCLVASSAEGARPEGYYEAFADGTAKWFHMRLRASERESIDRHAIYEIGYCVIGAAKPDEDERKAHWLWPVHSIKIKTRSELTPEQTGIHIDSQDEYWLFELGTPKPLAQAIGGFTPGHHHMKLTRASKLAGIDRFDELFDVYPWIGQGG